MNKLSLQNHTQRSDRGFTVIELMISTAVFSVILLMVTVAILQISRVYYKGIAETDTQNTTRNIMDSLSQAVQFNGGSITPTQASPIAGTEYALCIGNQRYTYTLGYELEEADPQSTLQQKKHVLVQDSSDGGCNTGNAVPIDLDSDLADPVAMRELMSPNMRLADLDVSRVGGPSSNLYKIKVRVVYGDSDLLTDPTDPNARCKSQQAGTQFCAISELSTVVTKRVGN